MWKVLIADDEPKIRQGLKNALETFDLPVAVCAEARNGVEALEKTKEFRPDILLVDICMPKLSGIQFLQEVRELKLGCRIIIVSGFNEFAYAQQAISLGVSSYLLKPIPEEKLKAELEGAIKSLECERKERKTQDFMKRQIFKNRPYLRDEFFRSLFDGNLAEADLREQGEFWNIHFSQEVTLILMTIREDLEGSYADKDELIEVYKSVTEKCICRNVEQERPFYVFRNRKSNVVGVLDGKFQDPEKIRRELFEETSSMNERKISVQIRSCSQREILSVFQSMEAQGKKIMECSSITERARQYIFVHYAERDLDLPRVASNIGCNPSYLSRIMKQELGISFKDYLTGLRIRQAKQLMRDRNLSLNQIAEKTGYSNQHYFSAAFKNCQGVSPSEYRRTPDMELKRV